MGWKVYTLTITNPVVRQLLINVTRLSQSGDPDVYVQAGAAPTFQSFITRDNGVNPVSLLTLNAVTSNQYYIGVYMWSATAAGDAVNYDITVSEYACPSNCHNATGNGACNEASGVCTCNNNFVSASCASAVQGLTMGTPANSQTVAGNTFSYYTLPAASAQYLNIQLETLSGDPDVYVKWNAVPTLTDYDALNNAGPSPNPYSVVELSGSSLHPDGTYYIGVWGYGSLNASFNLVANTYNCSGNCSNQGTCVSTNGSFSCVCNSGYTNSDCSKSSQQLTHGVDVTGVVAPNQWAYFDIIVESVLHDSRLNFDLAFTFTYTSATPALPNAVPTAGPAPNLYIAPAGSSNVPNTTYFDMRSTSSGPNTPQTLLLCKSQVTFADNSTRPRTAAIFNPLFQQISYTVSYSRIGACAAGCKSCSDNGTCLCTGGYRGLDCSIAPDEANQEGHSTGMLLLTATLALLLGFAVGFGAWRYTHRNAYQAAAPSVLTSDAKSASMPLTEAPSSGYSRMINE